MKDLILAKKLIKEHEGKKPKLYWDTMGILTVGYGHNCQAKPLDHNLMTFLAGGGALTDEQCEDILDQDLGPVVSELQNFDWFENLSYNRHSALCDMVFNIGMPRFLGFHHMLDAIERGDFEAASKEMLASEWANQVHDRAKELAYIIEKDIA